MGDQSVPKQQKTVLTWLVVICVLFIAAMITGIIFLARANPETTGKVRDIFIIILAMESLLIGASLVILVIQLAALINVVQNEIKPILASTKETVGNVKGTSQFLSKHAVAPIISVTSAAAGFRKLFEIIGFIKKK